MKTIYLMPFLLFVCSSIFSQNIPINFDECKYDMFFIQLEEQPQWGLTDTTIVDYFNYYFEKAKINLKSETGKMMIGIIIYENGRPCIHSFMNMTSIKIKTDEIKKLIYEMPYWLPGKNKGEPVVVLKNLLIEFKEGKLLSIN
ncbi:MAG: hypothetical protein GX259_10325 [Bacteroidales bacterium]|nr:hypothetical protein [Bacteroidales bacterium]